MIPGIVNKAMDRAHGTERRLEGVDSQYDNQLYSGTPKTAALPSWLSALKPNKGHATAAGRALGVGDIIGAPAGGVASGISKAVERKLFGQDFGTRRDPLGVAGTKMLESAGSELGKSGVGLLRDIANKAVEAAGKAGDNAARTAIIGDLKKNDSVLANADNKTLMEAYHTMTRFAPVLSTDKNAVRSFLRQAVMSGSGPDFNTIALLGRAEDSVTGDKRKHGAAISSGLAELLPALGRGALIGAGTGAVSGAVADDDDRLGGALKGALTGGALGGIGSALHGHLTREPKIPGYQGATADVRPKHPNKWSPGLGQNVNVGTPNMGNPNAVKGWREPTTRVDPDGIPSGVPDVRWVPPDAHQMLEDLQRWRPDQLV
jgi:hypothetical protein